jgi:nucleotide-binding universal stress UspA family protein
MNKIKKILAPTDLSEPSRAGVRYALELAASEGAEVIVYHVVRYNETAPYYGLEDGFLIGSQLPTVDEILEQDHRLLDKFLRDNFADLLPKAKVRYEVTIGSACDKIIEKAEEENADMIVMSTHGRTGILNALIGSVAERVVRLAVCPVLTVRPRKEKAAKQVAA